jgi:hypothetical protein
MQEYDYSTSGNPTPIFPIHTPLTILHPITKQPQKTKHHYPHETYEKLVCFIKAKGNWDKQKEVLQQICNKWSRYFRHNFFTQHEAWTAYDMYYLTKVSYALLITDLTLIGFEQLQSKVILQVLPHLGLSRHFPRTATFGPTKNGGLGLKHNCTPQNVRRLSHTPEQTQQ